MAKTEDLAKGSVLLAAYALTVEATDVLPKGEVNPVLMGLYGEVGGIMSTAKKHIREKQAYPGFKRAAEEEFGDALWYFSAFCRRINVSLDAVFHEITKGQDFTRLCAASDIATGAVAHVATPTTVRPLDDALFRLAHATTALLNAEVERNQLTQRAEIFARCYLDALHASQLSFADVVRMNIAKTRSAFITPAIGDLPVFDNEFDEDEQIPREFKIRISQRPSGKSYLRWNNVFIGAPLTDNIGDPDGYRFHDVFHFSHAAILHWSPVFRALIQQKRKSKGKYDEEQDSGRAIVVEEGLTAWIFARAKELRCFEGQDRISFGLLKTIQEFISGYEVSQCPLKLWERAILDGYSVFRQVRDAEGGWVIGNLNERTIRFEPL